MKLPHLALAVLIALIWGVNFIVIQLGLKQLSPQFLVLIRFIATSLPAVFFLKRPPVPFRWIALYGLIVFAMQFSFLFIGMRVGMTPSISSILMQTQAFITVFLAFMFLGEKPSKWQLVGGLIAFSGIGWVALHLDGQITVLGFVLVLAAASSWAVGNLISKRIGRVNMFAMVAWSSLVAAVPLLILELMTEGAGQMLASLQNLNGTSLFSILYITYLSTVVAYVGWNYLIARYAAITVVPFTLLVPIFAFLSSALFMDEDLQPWKLQAAALVLTGLFINIAAPRLMLRVNRLREAT